MTPSVVAAALSGGIDSLAAGFLLKQRYKKVFGIHFTTGYEDRALDTRALEDQLGFGIHTLDLSRTFEKEVVDYFISTYRSGRTPNPCLLCNQKIKFGALVSHALSLGAQALATGHYARVINAFTLPDSPPPIPWLEKGEDPQKDQSYFLSLVDPEHLNRLIFPLADMTKTQVRDLARENQLRPLTPSESQDICFIREKSFARFIIKKTGMTPAPGKVKDITGKVVGTHNGLHTFTVGQRRGINIPAEKPYYVRSITPCDNTLHVCFKEDLAQGRMEVTPVVWNDAPFEELRDITVKIRYSHKGAGAALIKKGALWEVEFDTPQNAVTPGQAAVVYRENRVLGAGIIT